MAGNASDTNPIPYRKLRPYTSDQRMLPWSGEPAETRSIFTTPS
jgi:hypothetical protein